MHERWYGDPRDLIKWATLVHVANAASIQTIVQIGFVTADMARPAIKSGDDEFPVQDSVWQHFRNLQDIKRLASTTGLSIEVFDQAFSQRHRSDYVDQALGWIAAHQEAKLVFLDPDTGLAKTARGPRHVSVPELQRFWSTLSLGDCLVLYQHAWRSRGWEDEARSLFCEATSTPDAQVYRSVDVGRDVVFLVARRGTETLSVSVSPTA